MPGLGRSPGEGNGNPSNSLAWTIPWREEPGGLLIVHGVTKSQTQLNDWHYVWEDTRVWAYWNHSFMYISAICASILCLSHPEFLVLSLGSGCSLTATMLQVFSFLISLRAQDFTVGGLESLMTADDRDVTLFTDIAGNTPFLTFTEPNPFPKT